MKHDDTSED